MNVVEEQIKTITQLMWKVEIRGGDSKAWIEAWNALQDTLNGTLSILPTENLKELMSVAGKARELSERCNQLQFELARLKGELEPVPSTPLNT
jgi:uncharacterized small protein (DUF1192 family)